ncbi:TonB-dependent receptor [Rhodohalobacter sp. SW132]|uniref:TonB-dependent receptor n=1 Tax=Rhodohalobacter sp. SW132 TaxID=2293433 RepID=UPI001313FDB6|nr:TonB-dependent receptor [Rhodohalobacter sp. SW132]
MLVRFIAALVAILMVVPGITAQVSNSESTSTSEQILAFQNQMPKEDSDAYARLHKVINLHLQNATLEEALNSVADQAGLKLMYRKALLQEEKKYSYDGKSFTVYEALWEILDDTGLQFAISNNQQLVLLRSRSSFRSDLEAYAISQAQTGSITGRVTDASTGEALFGANILVEDTSIGTATNIDGEYTLQRLPAGELILIVRYLGYITKNIEITIVAGETIERNISLELDQVEGEEVVIGAQALGQAQAIRTQLSSNSIVNVVSEDRLKELADANAAESLGRLPGVSIVRDGGEARNVAIRGLSSRYNNITFDGVRLPSTDFDGRSVDLHFISQEMLSGIELYKSNRPDMDADAIGGTVNFNLANIPEESFLRFNLKGGYSGQVEAFENFGASVSGSRRFWENRIGFAGSFDIQRNDRSSDELLTTYSVVRPRRAGEPHAPLETSDMNVFATNETRDRIGGSLMFDIHIPNGTIFLSGFASRLNRDVGELRRRLLLAENRQQWHYRTREIEVDVYSTRLSGEHSFPSLNNVKLEWRLSHSVSSRHHPFDHDAEFRERNAFRPEVNLRGDITTLADFAYNDFRNTELRRTDLTEIDARERDAIGQIDITLPWAVSDLFRGDLKFGGKILDKARDRDNRLTSLFMANFNDATLISEEGREMVTTDLGNISMINYVDENYSRENLFLGNFGLPHGLDRDLVNSIYHIHRSRFVDDLSALTDNQGGKERISAAYVMAEMNIGSRLMFMPGVRYEQTDGQYEAVHGVMSGTLNHTGWVADTSATRNFDQIFPMFQLRYEMTDWFQVRMAYTKSSSRPSFSEMVPRSAINPEGRWVRRGNPGLLPSEAINYDLFFTFSGNRIGMFTIGGFYKEIDNLIYLREMRILADYEELGLSRTERNYQLVQPFNNPLETNVRGLEVEWQSNFTFLRSPFNGIVINANITAMNTETQYPRSEAIRTSEGIVRVDTFRVGSMPQQPDYVANISVGYDYRGFSARVTMLHQGPQLFSVGLKPEFDSNTQKLNRFDAVIRQQLFGENLSIYLNLHNITNEPDAAQLFSDVFPTKREFFGRSFDLGVRLTF